MILVTGATGILGGHLLWHLLQSEKRVRVLKRNNSNLTQLRLIFSFYHDNLDNYSQNIEWSIGDVLDKESLQTVVEGVETIYHCAAIVSFSNAPPDILATNVQGTKNIVDVLLEKTIRKFCFVSSIAALGTTKKDVLITEKLAWEANKKTSPYALSKYLSEKIVWEAIKKGLPAVIVNPGVILGIGLATNGTMKLFRTVDKGLPIYTNGGSGYVDVQDVCKAMIQLTQSNITGERFVLVGENISNRELLNAIADALGKPRPFICGTSWWMMPLATLLELASKFLQKKTILDRGTVRSTLHRSYYSSEKIQKKLHFHFSSIEKSIEEIAHFYAKNKSY